MTATAVLAVPSLAFAQDAEDATATEPVVAEESAAEPAPVPAEPAPAPDPKPVAPAPPPPAADVTVEGSGNSSAPVEPVTKESAPAPAPVVTETKETSDAGNVAPTPGVIEDAGGGGIAESSGEIRASRGAVAGASGGVCGRVDVGPVPGQNQQVHDDLAASGCTASAVSVENSPVTVGGITFTFSIADSPQGEVLNFTTDVPFTGTLLVKGGSTNNDGGHFRCDFVNVTSGTCHAPVNPNNNRYFGFSHLDICVRPAGTVPPPPPDGQVPPGGQQNPPGGGNQPGGGGGGGNQPGGGGGGGDEDVLGDEDAEAVVPPRAVPAAVATAAPTAEELPFTGIDSGWLALMAGGLLLGGAMLRRTAS